MAAILCKTIGELCASCCECMKLPCSYLGEACGKSCKFMGEACGKSCKFIGDVICTPFGPYLIVTLSLNTPAVVFAIKSIEDPDCLTSVFRWLLVNGAFALIHMIAAFYITDLIRKPALTNGETPTINATTGLNSPKASGDVESNFRPLSDGVEVPGGANSFKRVKHVLCYDKGMAIYILIFLIWVVWMGVGLSRRIFYGDAGDCADQLHYMSTSIACGYVWMSLVGLAFTCSFCCLR